MLRFFKKNKQNKKSPYLGYDILNKFEDSINISYSDRNIKLKENLIWQEIQQLDKKTREEIALLALSRLIDENDKKYNHEVVRRKIFKSEFNEKAQPSRESLLKLF